MQGNSCTQIVKALSELSSVADSTNASGAVFGDFILSGGAITTSGTAISAQRISTSGKIFETGASLYLPNCDGSPVVSADLANNMKAIVAAMKANKGKSNQMDSAGVDLAKSGSKDAVNSLKSIFDLTASPETKAWVYVTSGDGAFYFTSESISDYALGAQLSVTKYDVKTQSYSTVTATIANPYLEHKKANDYKQYNYNVLRIQ